MNVRYDKEKEEIVKLMTYDEMAADSKKAIKTLVDRSNELEKKWGLSPEQHLELANLCIDFHGAGMIASRNYHVWNEANST